MTARRENLRVCENCKLVLATSLRVFEQHTFCSDHCTHEWSAVRLESVSHLTEERFRNVALAYVEAVLLQRGQGAVWTELLTAACTVSAHVKTVAHQVQQAAAAKKQPKPAPASEVLETVLAVEVPTLFSCASEAPEDTKP